MDLEIVLLVGVGFFFLSVAVFLFRMVYRPFWANWFEQRRRRRAARR